MQLVSNNVISIFLVLLRYVGHKGEGKLLGGLNSLSAFLEGILIPKPPCRTGKAKRAHPKSFGIDLPVTAGSSCVLNAVSRGDSRWLILGVTLLR